MNCPSLGNHWASSINSTRAGVRGETLREDGGMPTYQLFTVSLQLLLQVFRLSRWIVVLYLVHPRSTRL